MSQQSDNLMSMDSFLEDKTDMSSTESKRPNQSLEPTATRRVNSLSMIKAFAPNFPLGVGSGGSAPSR
jgi:hypothetical protein